MTPQAAMDPVWCHHNHVRGLCSQCGPDDEYYCPHGHIKAYCSGCSPVTVERPSVGGLSLEELARYSNRARRRREREENQRKHPLFSELNLKTLQEGRPQYATNGRVQMLLTGGKGSYQGLSKQNRPRIVRVLGNILRGRPGAEKGCMVCGEWTQWMWLASNWAQTFELLLCTRCEGVFLNRHLQAYVTLKKEKEAEAKGKGRAVTGGYHGPLLKPVEEVA